ncbi:putative non-specific serine/threonine protein kinase [Rosa chinensis]|uniref:Putative non-specific serine/threonine protein kinase n=1 Tax=Rosa chinensis TaxID=74649 RepID=A0A2P6R3D1_ROSCH|nr:putative non-specific serine/threonine protein kinase [Rosa chinensis]
MLPSLLELPACEIHHLPQSLPYVNFTSLLVLDLSANNFNSSLPQLLFNVRTLVKIFWTNSLKHWPADVKSVSPRSLNGRIPASISNMENLTSLDLSKNYLSGDIPTDWKGLQSLTTIDFSDNNLSGQIPSSMCSQLPSLHWLRLSNNNLSGELEKPLQHCTYLDALDLGGNKFSGAISTWIGERSFSYLLLGANMFTGNIPQQICSLSYVQVLNLSQNILSGSDPSLDALVIWNK